MKGLLIHATSLAFKAYYSLPSIPGKRGEKESILTLFLRVIFRLLDEFKPQYIACVFEEGAPKEIKKPGFTFTSYHPNIPDSLKEELEKLKIILESMGIYWIEQKGYCGEDIIATLTALLKNECTEVYIVSPDKTLWQLVDEKVKVINPFQKFKIIDHQGLKREGLLPSQIPEYLVLIGEKNLGIPGIEKIGEKRAKEILKKWGTLNNLLRKGGKENWEKVIATKESYIKLSKKIATLNPEVPLKVSLESLRWKGWERKKLKETFRKFGLNDLLIKIMEWEPEEKGKVKYITVRDEESLKLLLKELQFAKLISLDTETTSPNPHQAEIVGISLCTTPGVAYYIPLKHAYLGVPSQLPEEKVIPELKKILENKPIIGQNIKYDYVVLRNKGIHLKKVIFDTMIAAHLISSGQEFYNLRSLSMKYLGERKKSYRELVEKGRSIKEVLIEKVAEYTCEDVDFTFRLKNILEEEMERRGVKGLFERVEMPLLTVLAEMERTGIKVDENYLKELKRKCEREIREISYKIYQLAGETFNLNSPKQVARILFQKLGLKPPRKIKTGYSTSWDVLQLLENQHPIIPYLMEMRNLQKILHGFINPLLEAINPSTGRIHTSFHQTSTSTGRLSSSNPNLQNIPIRGKWGEALRKAFIAEKDHFIISADYSQIELRVMAHFSQDEELIRAFKEEKDIHSTTASHLFKVNPEEITSEMRRKAKTINFGIIYGITPKGLAKELGIAPEEAEKYIGNYFHHHPGVKKYIEETLEFARKEGYVKTLLGRRRYFQYLHSDNRLLREAQEREAINAPIQGSAAEIIKMAMVEIFKNLQERKSKAKLLLQVHDELVLEVPEKEVKEITSLIKRIMENIYPLRVPLKVEIGIGKNWWEAHH